VLNYLPNVIAAVIIFVIAGVIATAAGAAAAKLMGDTPTGKIVGTAIPALVMGIAVFMVLNQLKIAPGDRSDHLHRAARIGRAGRCSGVRAGWARRGRAAVESGLQQGPGEQGPGQAGHAAGQGPRPRGSAVHWGAKTMSLIVGVVLGGAALVALATKKRGAFGLLAANHVTELVWGAAGVALILLSLMPRVGAKTEPGTDPGRPSRRQARRVELEPRRGQPEASATTPAVLHRAAARYASSLTCVSPPRDKASTRRAHLAALSTAVTNVRASPASPANHRKPGGTQMHTDMTWFASAGRCNGLGWCRECGPGTNEILP
jgi:hypothetical protein